MRDTEWDLPTFIARTKDGTVRWVSDLRELNKAIKKTQHTLPIITDVPRRRKGYEVPTKLDKLMMFYIFALDNEAQKMCTIVTPFGPFKYIKF